MDCAAGFAAVFRPVLSPPATLGPDGCEFELLVKPEKRPLRNDDMVEESSLVSDKVRCCKQKECKTP